MTLESQEEARSLKVSLSLFQSLDFILKAVARVGQGGVECLVEEF